MSQVVERRRQGQLLVASVLTGIFGALTVYWSELQLGLIVFAPLAQLWTIWATLSASVTFSVQHWIVKSMVGRPGERPGWTALLRTLAPVVVAVTLLAWFFVDQWFDGHLAYPILCGALVVGTGLNGWARGLAAASSDARRLSMMVVGENLIRLALVVPLVLVDAAAVWYGVALVAGFTVVVLGFGVPVATGGDDSTSRAGRARQLGAAGAVGLVSYATAFGGPLLLALQGASSSSVSALFLVITLARVPFIVVLGLLPRVAFTLESMRADGRSDDMRRLANRLVLAAGLAAALVGAVALAIAEPTFGRAFGTNSQFGSDVYAAIAAASLLALAALVLSMMVLTNQRLGALVVVWSVPVVVSAAIGVSSWRPGVGSLAAVLLAVEVTLVATLWGLQRLRPQVG